MDYHIIMILYEKIIYQIAEIRPNLAHHPGYIMKHQIMQTCIMEHHIMQHCIMEHQIMQTCIIWRHMG